MSQTTTETPKQLQKLHKALKASKAAKYFDTIHWPEYPKRLSLENPKPSKYDDFIIHITVSEHNPERFAYLAQSNEFFDNPDKYLVVEAKEEASSKEVIEAVYRLLSKKS